MYRLIVLLWQLLQDHRAIQILQKIDVYRAELFDFAGIKSHLVYQTYRNKSNVARIARITTHPREALVPNFFTPFAPREFTFITGEFHCSESTQRLCLVLNYLQKLF